MDHPFTEGKRGVCIYPVLPHAAASTHVPCGKMRILHEPRAQEVFTRVQDAVLSGNREALTNVLMEGVPAQVEADMARIDDLHIHDFGDTSWEEIKAGRYDCVDPDCPDR